MIRASDFKSAIKPPTRNLKNRAANVFSVILCDIKAPKGNTKYSIANAVKPLTYCASICGTQLIRYTQNGIEQVRVPGKMYCLLVVIVFTTLLVLIRPSSWSDTKLDVPLNVLTKSFGIHHTAEVIYSIFIVSFGNHCLYVKLFKKLDEVDYHFESSKLLFMKRRMLSIILLIVPIVLVFCTFWLRKFHLQNIVAHSTFFLIMLQGSVFSFFIISIYVKQVTLNVLIMKKKVPPNTPRNSLIYICRLNPVIKKLCREPIIVERNLKRRYCWLEIMQIYDKIADCTQLFNDIYSGQVLVMFNSWLLCTLLIICRSLSPTVKYSEVVLSDLFLYSCINSRPLCLAKMCEYFVIERKRTMSILLSILVHGDLEEAYSNQVQTMLELVEARRLEISASVFTVNISTVLTFSGRVISYVVLVIQYFYMHLFLKET